MTRCNVLVCKRHRVPNYALCEDHIRALLARMGLWSAW